MRKLLLIVAAAAGTAMAQGDTRLDAAFGREGRDIQSNCIHFSIGGCADLIFTEDPLHIAVGSMAPQNGFGAGPAFAYHWTPPTWRISLDADGLVSNNLSWRAGVYLTAIYTKTKITVGTGGSGPLPKPTQSGAPEVPVIHAYAQTESLKTLGFFGEGPNTSDTARSYFGMRETIVGFNGTAPIRGVPAFSVFGEANARVVALRSDPNQSSPSIEQAFNNATAPGLASQPVFAQLGEGVRFAPTLARGYLRLNYALTLQQYVPGSMSYSFQRLTMDFNHQIPIYKTTRTLLPKAGNGPDDCSDNPSSTIAKCPEISRNKEGSVSLRLLMIDSLTSGGNVVPFYFQPTLGGSDINGNMALPSYQDYRFRAPNSMLARATFEHSIWGPLGMTLMIDEGKVANNPSGLDFTHLMHSYAAGLTLRAGGFPMVYLMFAWGGHEGTHNIVNVNTSLLGGAARPSLY